MRKYRKQSGFTLIELLLVIGILGILATIGLSSFMSAITRGKDSQRKNDLAALSKALEAYMDDFGVYPDDDGNGNIVGCSAELSILLSACPLASSGRFQRSKQAGGEFIRIIYLDTFPTDPDSTRRYYYDNQLVEEDETGYILYAALENTEDKDVKRLNGDPDPAGWGVNCGNPSGTPVCNYKLSNFGVDRE